MNELADLTSPNAGLRELALFAGAGGGILGGHLLGWRTVCAVEYAAYPASVLLARQNDGILPPFPIWDDVRTFDGKPWRGIVDVVSGGFPCQDISSAGKGAGIDGARSGLWREMARIIGEVRPRYVFVENSPLLVSRGLAVVIGDLASLGYDARWMCLSAGECGANHERDRLWIIGEVSNTNSERELQQERTQQDKRGRAGNVCEEISISDAMRKRQQEQGHYANASDCQADRERKTGYVIHDSRWPDESGFCRVAHGVAARMDRIAAIGNGQVPRVAAAAFSILSNRGEGEQR